MFFMLAFTFMFFMNTVNGFFNQFVVGHSEWMRRRVSSRLFPASPSRCSGRN
jgi:Na+/melibiose symporter-like transporter